MLVKTNQFKNGFYVKQLGCFKQLASQDLDEISYRFVLAVTSFCVVYKYCSRKIII